MRASEREIRQVMLRQGGVIRLRDHPDLKRAILHLAERRRLESRFPGVYTDPRDDLTWDVRIRAVAMWRPDAVVVGRAAACMSFWRNLAAPVVELAVPTKQRPQRGVAWSRRRVPPTLRWTLRGVVISKPSLTVLDLIPELRGAAISKALHAGVPLAGMQQALELTPDRPHNALRRRLLHNYRHEPWSEAEQSMHALLRSARINGWIANYPMVIGGQQRFLDLVFEQERVCIEVDGYEFHGLRAETRDRFETDRFTGTTLTAAGWRVLRFTWRQILENPEWVLTMVKAALERTFVPPVARIGR